MATGYGVCVHIVYEHRTISCMGPRGQAGVNPYRGCVEIVRKSCNLSGVAAQPPDRNRTEPVRLAPWRHRAIFERAALSVRPPRCARAGIVRCHL